MNPQKNLLISILLTFVFLGSLIAQPKPANVAPPVIFDKVPTTIEEFVALRNKTAVTPEGGCAMFIMAMLIYKDNVKLGEKCFVVAVDRSELKLGDIYKGFDLLSWMTIISAQRNYPLIANSYVDGSSPENGYAISLPYKIKFGARNTYSGTDASGKVRMFVLCSGADSPRPITMIKNNKGLWKASKHSSLFTEIKEGAVDDDL